MEYPHSDRVRILLVEDEEDDYAYVCDLLSLLLSSGSTLQWVREYDEALGAIQTGRFDVCLLDHRLGARTGLEFLEEAARSGCSTPIVFLTGAGAADCLAKGELSAALLEKAIRHSVERAEAKKRPPREHEKLETLVRKRAEELFRANTALDESLRSYRMLAESVPGMVFQFVLHRDRSFSLPYMNNRFTEYSGISPQAVMADASLAFTCIHPGDRKMVLRAALQSAKTLRDFSLEHRMIDANGRLRWLRVESKPERLSNGDLLWNGISIDITERKRSEQLLLESQAWFHGLFDHAPLPYQSLDEHGLLLDVNRAWLDVLGYEKNEVVGRWFGDFLPPATADAFARNFAGFKEIGAVEGVEYDMVKKNGEAIRVSFDGRVQRDDEKRLVCTHCIFRDITRQKQTERKLRDSEELFRNLFEHHAAVKMIVDPGTGTIVNANQAAASYYGWPKEKLERMRIHDINADSLETVNREMARAANRDKIQFEFRHRLADGSLREVEVFSSKIEVRGNELLHSIVHDITERKQTRAALNRERQRFKQILDEFPYGICIIDRNYHIEYINPVLVREFGEPGDRKCYDYFQGSRTPCSKCYKELVFQGKALHWSWRSPGNGRDYDLVGLPLHSETGAVSMLEVFGDVTDRKQVEEALRRRTEELQAILDTVPATIWFKDGDNNFLRVNRAVCEMMGLPAAAIEGKNATELFPDWLAEKYYRDDLEVIHSGKPMMGIEQQLANGAGELRWVSTDKVPWFDAQGNPSGVLVFSVDITDRKLAEEEREKLRQQLAQSRKIESVGRLAGGVAHDYNNMLGVIIGYTEMALAGVNPDDPLHADLQEILNAAMRSADITRQLLAFARKQTISPVVLDLNETVEGMLKMLRRLIGENLDLAWFPKAGLAPVKMDPSQIDQILANLCVNARDAITGVGNVTIETDMVSFDEAYCAGHEGFVPGQFVLLAVSDSGCGMDRETLQSIFEPFFTTKEVDKGTGLGLSTVYGIVKQNGGFINVYSEPGSGTTFKIYLPCAREQVSQDGLREKKKESRGTETLLLVEDEQSILKLGKTILEQHGYTVFTACGPAEALELVKNLATPIHLLITDVIMPEMSGKDLYERLRLDNQHLECIFMSGYTANVIAHNGVLDQGVNFLQKPFSVSTLTEKVRGVLDR